MSLLTPESLSQAIDRMGAELMTGQRFIRQGEAITFALLAQLNHEQLLAASADPDHKPEDAGLLYLTAAMLSEDGLVEVAVDDSSALLDVGDNPRERGVTIEKVRQVVIRLPGTKVREQSR